ncbi:MAG: 2-hydroxyacid dehydrogenase [Candidatus Thermoplasmatota archaeon]|nr:2-hydroxyacid dehydrogenase [Candidatus Thermoplasmatota archaeon]
MKVSIMRDMDTRMLKRCAEILGCEVKSMDPSGADIQVIYRKYEILPELKMIQTISAGVDHLDFSRVPENVLVCSNAGAFADPVAEHAFALLLSVKKKVLDFDKQQKNGIYQKLPVSSLIGHTFGIFGYGGIGKSASKIAKSLRMHTIAYSRSRSGDENLDRFVDSPEELFSQSDVLLLSMPLNASTSGIVDGKLLSKFSGDTIVNVARAGVVNKDDMLQYLQQNQDKMYLTDVWWGEPDVKFPLPSNVLLTPHVGGINRDLEEEAVYRACQNVRLFIEGKKTEHVVLREEYSTGKVS